MDESLLERYAKAVAAVADAVKELDAAAGDLADPPTYTLAVLMGGIHRLLADLQSREVAAQTAHALQVMAMAATRGVN